MGSMVHRVQHNRKLGHTSPGPAQGLDLVPVATNNTSCNRRQTPASARGSVPKAFSSRWSPFLAGQFHDQFQLPSFQGNCAPWWCISNSNLVAAPRFLPLRPAGGVRRSAWRNFTGGKCVEFPKGGPTARCTTSQFLVTIQFFTPYKESPQTAVPKSLAVLRKAFRAGQGGC